MVLVAVVLVAGVLVAVVLAAADPVVVACLFVARVAPALAVGLVVAALESQPHHHALANSLFAETAAAAPLSQLASSATPAAGPWTLAAAAAANPA